MTNRLQRAWLAFILNPDATRPGGSAGANEDMAFFTDKESGADPNHYVE